MPPKNWNPAVRVLHWLAVLLVVGCVGAVWSHESFDKADPLRGQLMQLHFLLGGTIGLLTLLRLVTRALLPSPHHVMPPLIATLAKAGHLGLYLLLLLLPVCGYVAVSGKGLPINLLGIVELPPLGVSKDVAGVFKEIHEVLANGLIGLVCIHVAAALYHFKVLKDDVLQSMLGRAGRQN